MAGKKAAAKQASGFRMKEELIGVFCLGLAVMIFLALVSFHEEDPAWGSKTSDGSELHNYLGSFGASMARLLREGFGYGATLLPIPLVLFAISLFRKQSWRLRTRQAVGLVLLFLVLCTLLHLDLTSWFGDAFEKKGGYLGFVLGVPLVKTIGVIGGHILLIILFITSLMLAFQVSFVTLSQKTAAIAVTISGWVVSATAYRIRRMRRRKEKKDEQKKEPKRKGPIIETGSSTNGNNKAATPPVIPPAPEPVPASEKRQAPASDPAPVNEAIEVHDRENGKKNGKDKKTVSQLQFSEITGEYQLPPVDLLEDHGAEVNFVDKEQLIKNSHLLEEKLKSFDVDGKVKQVRPGPIVTMYEFEPAPGVRVTKVANLDKDLALALKASRIRIVAPLPDRGTIGIEVPNRDREIVSLKDILESDEFSDSSMRIPIAIGKDIFGNPAVTDLAEMPHLLVAGTTGSGKSVFLNCVVMSILFKHTPNDVRLLMVDPKMLEFQDYDGIPSLLLPVVTNVAKASAVLRQAVDEMERRYRLMAEMGVRNLEGYNRRVDKKNKDPEMKKIYSSDDDGNEIVTEEPIILDRLPYIVLIIDEFADLMMVAPKDILESVQRLAQMARAAGIHLILATQRPSKDVITGDIKANMAARITFQLRTKTDSRVIMDCNGAEALLGMGDMLYLPSKNPKLTRLHGAYISEKETKRVVDFVQKSGGAPELETMFSDKEEDVSPLDQVDDFSDEKYNDAKRVVYESQRATISYIQRILKIGYNRAARMIEQMEREGLISPPDNRGDREIFNQRFER